MKQSQSGDEEEEVQSLHEMITEALMGNIPVRFLQLHECKF